MTFLLLLASLLQVNRTMRLTRSIFLFFIGLLIAQTALATHSQESLTVINGIPGNPCVITAEKGLQNVLTRLDRVMSSSFSYGISEPNLCALPQEDFFADKKVRLILFKPDGLTDDSNQRDFDKAIQSKITNEFKMTIPENEQVIISGYKTMYHSDCLGQDCDKKAWGGCLTGRYTGDWDTPQNECLEPLVYKYVPVTVGTPLLCFKKFTWDQCASHFKMFQRTIDYFDYDGWDDCTADPNWDDNHRDEYLIEQYKWENPRSEPELAEFCREKIGPTAHAISFSLNKDNYRRTNEGALEESWAHFPITDDIINNNLDGNQNPVFNCDYFDSHRATTICNPNDDSLAQNVRGYVASIIFEGNPADDIFRGIGGDALVFEVHGKLSLRNLDIRLKSKNAKVVFQGDGVVEFVNVAIYGEEETETLVEFGAQLGGVHIWKNPNHTRGRHNYGLGLFPQHEGIQSYITVHDKDLLHHLGTLTSGGEDLLFPSLKLVLPVGGESPKPFVYISDADFFRSESPTCVIESVEEKTCRLQNIIDNSQVMSMKKEDGGTNDLQVYHYGWHILETEGGLLSFDEGAFYYSKRWDPIEIISETSKDKKIDFGKVIPKGGDNNGVGKEIPTGDGERPSIPCPPDTVRNVDGFCIRTQANPADSDEDDADLDEQSGWTQIATPEAQVERNPWGPHRDLLESNDNGPSCSLNRNGKQNSVDWIFFPILSLLLLAFRFHRTRWVHWVWFGCLAVILLFPAFSALGSEPEEINFSCLYYHPENPNYQSSDSCEIPLYNRPCVVLDRAGASSLEDLLERLDASMSLFNYGGEHNTMCAVDDAGYGEVEPVVNSNTRLLLFKPEGLNAETRSHRELERPIPSDIGKALEVNVPQERHLIIAGYKAMVRGSCLGHDCGDALGFYFPIREVVADDFNLRPELDYHPANPILNCDYFDMLGHSTFCNPNDGTYAYREKGYHAEINILEGGSLEFIVDGKLSLRYLDIHLKSGNSKIKFSGRGIVEFTEVGIYGEAALESIVEFGDTIQVRHKINPNRLRSSVSYGLGLFANHEGIQNFISISNLVQAVTALNYWFDHGLLYPKFKLAFPAGADGPNPFLVRENFFPDPVFCYQRSSKEEECELDSDHRNLGLVIGLEPRDGGGNDLNTYHFVYKSITPLDGKIPVVENGVYYPDGGDSIQIETREVTENPNLKKGSSQSADEEKAEGEKEIPPSNPPDLSSTLCPPDTARNAEGFCVRTTDEDEVELDERRGGTQIATPETQVERNPWGPPRELLESDNGGSGCSLNRNGNSQGWILLPLLLLLLLFQKVALFSLK